MDASETVEGEECGFRCHLTQALIWTYVVLFVIVGIFYNAKSKHPFVEWLSDLRQKSKEKQNTKWKQRSLMLTWLLAFFTLFIFHYPYWYCVKRNNADESTSDESTSSMKAQYPFSPSTMQVLRENNMI